MDLEEMVYEYDPEYKKKFDEVLWKYIGINKQEWDRGYAGAKETIGSNEQTAQEALNTALRDIEPNDFTEGWIKACEDAGAKHPLD